jgi:hypothetical protein
LLVDFRLLGWGLRQQPVGEVAREVQPWLIWSLVGMIVTGIPLFASLAASKYYVNDAFRLKMYFFAAAILFTFTVRQRIVMGAEPRANSSLGKAVAVTSMFLWLSVGILGRGIGFY